MILDLNFKPFKKYSQTGEEGVLIHLFDQLGTTNSYLVDFGAGEGFSLSNSQYLLEQGWTGLRMDGIGTGTVKKEYITAENIIGLFKKYEVPSEFDLLCLDIDGNDYWVLKQLIKHYSPRVIVLEINGCLPAGVSQTIQYNAEFEYQGDDYYGASFLAFKRLLTGYVAVHNQDNLNAFFVRKDLCENVEVEDRCTPYHAHNDSGIWVVDPEKVERFPVSDEQPLLTNDTPAIYTRKKRGRPSKK
jgi:hypothetical protein